VPSSQDRSHRIVADPGQLRGRRYGNVVVAGTQEPIDAVGLAKAMRRGPAVASVRCGDALDAFIDHGSRAD